MMLNSQVPKERFSIGVRVLGKVTILVLIGLLLSASLAKPGSAGSQSSFVHPGLLNDDAELALIKGKFRAGEEPWVTALKAIDQGGTFLTHQPQAIASFVPREEDFWPHTSRLTEDCEVVYGSALLWYMQEDDRYAEKAVEILMDWTATLRSIGPQGKLPTSYGWPGCIWGAEILRGDRKSGGSGYAGWGAGEVEAFEHFLLETILPSTAGRGRDCSVVACTCWSAFQNHVTWGMAARMSIGIFTEDEALVYESIDDYKLAVDKYLLSDGVTNETCRRGPEDPGCGGVGGGDLWHAQMGIMPLLMLTEMASHQPEVVAEDLYAYQAADGSSLERSLNLHAQFVGYPWRYADVRERERVADLWHSVDGGRCTIPLEDLPGPGTSWWYGYEVAYSRYRSPELGAIVDDVMRNPDRPYDSDLAAESWGRTGFATLTHAWELQSRQDHSFADVPPDHWAYADIEALYQDGYTAGCSVEPRRYCPEDTLVRAESAVFMERGIHGAAYLPGQPSDQIFGDVPLWEWFAKWATGLWEDGYTAGCGTDPLVFCPLQAHTRAEATVFFTRMLKGKDYQPPKGGALPYADVASEDWYHRWVAAAYAEGIVGDCEAPEERGDDRFRPEAGLTRAEAACMMARAKEGAVQGGQVPKLAVPEDGTYELTFNREIIRGVPADLDGDGLLDFVMRTIGGTLIFEARRNDGRSNGSGQFLWEVNTQDDNPFSSALTAWDFNGDGKWEVYYDYLDKATGRLRHRLVDGATGSALVEGEAPWAGDTKCGRHTAIAYAGGSPRLIISRDSLCQGGVPKSRVAMLEAWTGVRFSLKELWTFDQAPPGSHDMIRTIDLDEDGSDDEILVGCVVLNSDGTLRYSVEVKLREAGYATTCASADQALVGYFSEMDPELIYVTGGHGFHGGVSALKARTGEVIWSHRMRDYFDAWTHFHAGWLADRDPSIPGAELMALDRDSPNYVYLRVQDGAFLQGPMEFCRPVLWDGDPYYQHCQQQLIAEDINSRGDLGGPGCEEVWGRSGEGLSTLVVQFNLDCSEDVPSRYENLQYRKDMALQSQYAAYWLGALELR